MLNKTFRAGDGPVEDGGAMQPGRVQLLGLGLALPIGNKGSSIRGEVCTDSSFAQPSCFEILNARKFFRMILTPTVCQAA
jgi:hypothetical protein